MTLNECTIDENAITAAQVQGLHAFMASEAKAAAKGLQAAATELGVEGGDSVQAAADECQQAPPDGQPPAANLAGRHG